MESGLLNVDNWRAPSMSPKNLFYVQVLLICISLFGISWMTSSYFFYNAVYIFLFGSGIILKEDHTPLEMAIVVNIISGVLDIFSISIYHTTGGIFLLVITKISALINMVMRVVAHFVLTTEVSNRRDGTVNQFYGGTASGPYQNIDGANGPAV